MAVKGKTYEEQYGFNKALELKKAISSLHKILHLKHGYADKSITYRSWVAMRQRCRDKNAGNYPLYGGRGITICDRWNLFENFLADMGERSIGTTLDRIDSDGNYEPSNCRWATYSEQAKNRRRRADGKFQRP